MRSYHCCVLLLALFTAFGLACNQAPKSNNATAPLMVAAREGKADVVRALLSGNDVNVNMTDEQGNTPLIEAARFGHDDTARALIEHGANVQAKNKAGQTALMLAVSNGHDDVVRVLKEAGARE